MADNTSRAEWPMSCRVCEWVRTLKAVVVCAFIPALVVSLFHGGADAQVCAAMIGVSLGIVVLSEESPDE